MTKNYYDKPRGSKFRCMKTTLYRKCGNCYELNGGCDYSEVIDFEPKSRRNRCPICEYKRDELKCLECVEQCKREQMRTAREGSPLAGDFAARRTAARS